jgi:hypothetical protein
MFGPRLLRPGIPLLLDLAQAPFNGRPPDLNPEWGGKDLKEPLKAPNFVVRLTPSP